MPSTYQWLNAEDISRDRSWASVGMVVAGCMSAIMLLSCPLKQSVLDKLCLGVEAARYRTVQGDLL